METDILCVYLSISLLLQSSLLMTILGELPISDGDRSIHGKIGYASQQAWIFNGTVKENILFGQDFDKDRYLKVIDACALEKVRYGRHTLYGHYQYTGVEMLPDCLPVSSDRQNIFSPVSSNIQPN